MSKTYKALTWLEGNPNPAPLGFNVLRTRKRAVKLVRALYEAGAQSVLVTDVGLPHPSEPGTVSNTLLIKPPRGRHHREFYKALAALDADELGPWPSAPGYIRAWWD